MLNSNFKIPTTYGLLTIVGIPREAIPKHFRGEMIYSAETETHFPHLTVGETLKFAALARTPKNRLPGVTRDQYAEHMRDVTMAQFGLLHTMNTRVGDEYIRGVSGGERKRVSIAEVCLNGSSLQCWDNSTRGLDSATALEFIRNLNISAEISNAAILVSLYQASQDAFDQFHKVTVFYEGRQIYFGSTKTVKKFFEDMGWFCPERQTTGDFLTSLTSPSERIAKPGWEDKVPRTSDEFAQYWRNSPQFAELIEDIDNFNAAFPENGDNMTEFQLSRSAQKSKRLRAKSPYTIAYSKQIQILTPRAWNRLIKNPSLSLTMLLGNLLIGLLMGSIFYNMEFNTDSFFSRGACLFFAILFNALSSVLEVMNLFAQRPIVEKHNRYALYHPSAEAIATFIADLPTKIVSSVIFDLTIYFMTNLRREVGPFFIFFMFSFLSTITMSIIFRIIGSMTRSIPEALTPACLVILALTTTSGFVIPVVDMHPWFRWINYLNPLAFGFEALMINEFRNREFPCSQFVPRGPIYQNITDAQRICAVVGATLQSNVVQGSDYIINSFEYYPKDLWRNFGIVIAFLVGLAGFYLVAAENIEALKSKGEILIFQKGHHEKKILHAQEDVESGQASTEGSMEKPEVGAGANLSRQEGIFQWKDVCYDIKIKNKPRRLLDHVDGWVEPGTLTALMGASGAGKTTLLDVLASRVTMGVVTGDMLVNGSQRENSFQRKTGYVQQQDVHLETSTVREALNFSALLRQPSHLTKAEKLAYVDEVIKILEMEHYADAVVGISGEGLNVEQRKRLTIGVELAARPQLLLFLDEPTSGLDSQTAWSICSLMRKLANNGQAILCTIHQPSAMLFQEFDRLLFLKSGGQTVYFGNIGKNASTLIDYFVRNGSQPCPPSANPAEWILQVIGAAPGSHTDIDWFKTWRNSSECAKLHQTLDDMRDKLVGTVKDDPSLNDSFAVGTFTQIKLVTQRVMQQYWRTPSYIYSKIFQCIISPLYVGFTFYKAKNDIQGMQNQMFSIFVFLIIFAPLVEQMLPHFATQRSLYEVRERPSKTYSWVAFMLSNIFTELPWQTLVSVFSYFCYYYTVGYYRNAGDMLHERGAMVFMLIWAFYLFTSTFAHMIIAGIEDANTGGNIATILFTICLGFCGVLATPEKLPHFWIFMYRVSPLTYIVSGMMAAGCANAPIQCSAREILYMETRPGMTCAQYLGPFANATGGYILNPQSNTFCHYCITSNSDYYLATIHSHLGDVWRNFGLIWIYIIFNICAACFLYWLIRVPKKWSLKSIAYKVLKVPHAWLNKKKVSAQ